MNEDTVISQNKAFSHFCEKIFDYRNTIEDKHNEQWVEPVDAFSTHDNCFTVDFKYVHITMMTEKINNRLIVMITFKKTSNKYIMHFEDVKINNTTNNYVYEPDYLQCVKKTLEYMF